MSAVMQHGADVQLQVLPTAACYELVAFHDSLQNHLPSDWPQRPGEARRGADGSPEILKIAADRWLILNPRAALAATGAALAPFCALTDVTAKWREFRLTGASAVRLLANSADVEELLEERDCARTALFDCPALLCKLNEGFALWIERSYEHAFGVAVQQAIRAQANAP
jgi:sarcosine oxidase gamma subunit